MGSGRVTNERVLSVMKGISAILKSTRIFCHRDEPFLLRLLVTRTVTKPKARTMTRKTEKAAHVTRVPLERSETGFQLA